MEQDSGAPYYEAKIISKPVRRIDGTAIAKVAYTQRNRQTIARFYSNQDEAMQLKEGDIVHVCPYDGDAYIG